MSELVGAQGLHVVPSSHESADASALASAAGVGTTERQQILIDASHLTGVLGREIHALVFRRDFRSAEPLLATQSQVTVRVGIAPHTAAEALPSFTANLRAAAVAFQGVVQVPASTDPTGRPVGWDPTDTVEIPLQPAFTYPGGTLCIEIDGVVATTPEWWPVDAIQDPAVGVVVREGHACGSCAAVLGDTASVAHADSVVGRTAVFKLFGEPHHPAFLLIGLDTFGQPIGLGPLGAPGCELRVDAFATVATMLSPPLPDPELGALANVHLQFPADPRLLGGSFVAQFAGLAPPAFVTSNTPRCQFSPTALSTAMSLVWAQPGRNPIVQFRRVPVVGLRWR